MLLFLKLAYHFLKKAVPAKAVSPSLVTFSPLPSWQLSLSGKAWSLIGLCVSGLSFPLEYTFQNILEHEGRDLFWCAYSPAPGT